MIIREIQKSDNKGVEKLIRTCLLEFGGDKPGCAWTDPELGQFYELYQKSKRKYWVVEDNDKIVAGCGIGPLDEMAGICELQKMYAYKEYRGIGISNKLLHIALEFGKIYYDKCYLETFSNMIAANKFYKKNGFARLEEPLINTIHYACDVWYLKEL